MSRKDIQILEDGQTFEDNSNELPPSDIVAFNELRSCADLLRLYDSGQLNIEPEFQRDIVWSKPEQTRFIDSLTKQLPIPSMCISLDYKTEKRLMIDGLQRMQSIINFLSKDNWQLSSLDDIDDKLSGKTVLDIKSESKTLYDRVQNVMIPITVIRCDYSKKGHNEYLFTIFHRLNSGGVKLNNQEIRNCIYSGSLNSLLMALAESSNTKKLFGSKKRFATEEMLLRFFALSHNLGEYNGKLSQFLNDFMFKKRYIDENELSILSNIYNETVLFINDKIMEKIKTKAFGKTFLEGLLYGVSQNIKSLQNKSGEEIIQKFNNFLQLEEYSAENLKEGLGAKDKVIARLNAAKLCFSQ